MAEGGRAEGGERGVIERELLEGQRGRHLCGTAAPRPGWWWPSTWSSWAASFSGVMQTSSVYSSTTLLVTERKSLWRLKKPARGVSRHADLNTISESGVASIGTIQGRRPDSETLGGLRGSECVNECVNEMSVSRRTNLEGGRAAAAEPGWALGVFAPAAEYLIWQSADGEGA